MKLEKFDKNKKRKIIVASVVLGLFLIIGGVYLFRSHAIFEEHKTFDVIFGKVPPFKKKEKDLELAILVNGESSTEIPEGKDYRVEVTCDDEALSGTWDYSTWELTVKGKLTTVTTCSIKFDSIYNITVDGESRNTFPEKGDYQYNMTCNNVTNYSWNEETWTPTVTGVNKDSSCDVVFKSTNNIITRITLDGEEIESYPNKDENLKATITCTPESVTGEWDKENWKVKKINNITKEATCEVAFETIPPFYAQVEIGDFVAYTPSRTSYIITGTSSGCPNSNLCNGASSNGSQTFNPSELNLWRVIKKNSDGTIEIVSEYVGLRTDGDYIYFYGKEGYRRSVETLNDIARAYEIVGITSGSHHMGYDGEQATCTYYHSCSDQKTDYTTLSEDIRNVNKAYGGSETCTSGCASLKSYKSNATTTAALYALASRVYMDNCWLMRYVHTRGNLLGFSVVVRSEYENPVSVGVRPIVTLKSGLTATEGSKDGKNMWTIN